MQVHIAVWIVPSSTEQFECISVQALTSMAAMFWRWQTAAWSCWMAKFIAALCALAR